MMLGWIDYAIVCIFIGLLITAPIACKRAVDETANDLKPVTLGELKGEKTDTTGDGDGGSNGESGTPETEGD